MSDEPEFEFPVKAVLISIAMWAVIIFGIAHFASGDVMRVEILPPPNPAPQTHGAMSAVYDPVTLQVTAVAVMYDSYSGIAGWDTSAEGWVNPDEKTYFIESMGIADHDAGYNGFPSQNWDFFTWSSSEPRLLIERPRKSDSYVGTWPQSEPVFLVPEPSAAVLGLLGLMGTAVRFRQRLSRHR